MARKALLNVVVVVAALGTGLYLSRAPWKAYRQQRSLANAQMREMRDAERQRADLLHEEARVRSSVGREELARKAGFVRPGEERLNP